MPTTKKTEKSAFISARDCSTTTRTYLISNMNSSKPHSSFINCGTNDSISRPSEQIISQRDCCINIVQNDDHELTGTSIGAAGVVVKSQLGPGPVVAILRHHALHRNKASLFFLLNSSDTSRWMSIADHSRQ
jgi:hypothetical protein